MDESTLSAEMRGPAPGPAQWQIVTWLGRAWRRMGWRHVALAAILNLAAVVFQPYGGLLFFFPSRPPSDPIYALLVGRWLVETLPVVFAALVADEAYDSGVRPLIGYGAALAVVVVVAPFLEPIFLRLVGARNGGPFFDGFLFLLLMLDGGFFIAAWGYLHVTRRAMALRQAAQSEQVRQQQRLIAARLATLQARVDPEFLFDALTRVGAMHASQRQAADRLLADLITLLRAMLTVSNEATSTVEREFELAQAWLRVDGQLNTSAELKIACEDEVSSALIQPMLVLPMVRTTARAQGLNRSSLLLEASLVPAADVSNSARLRITLLSDLGQSSAPSRQLPEHAAELRGRVAQLYGPNGSLWVETVENGERFVLELPLITGEGD